jgi:hypothetical protein
VIAMVIKGFLAEGAYWGSGESKRGSLNLWQRRR